MSLDYGAMVDEKIAIDEAVAEAVEDRDAKIDKLTIAITAALGEIKRNEGSPRLGLRGIERILSHALGGK